MAFETEEYSFDAFKIKDILYQRVIDNPYCKIFLSKDLNQAEINGDKYKLYFKDNTIIYTSNVINTTYASINQLSRLFNLPSLEVKYEIAEIILCKSSPSFLNLGITLMDGPFFSAMPYGDLTYHSLSAVEFTPHRTSSELNQLPKFSCQNNRNQCSPLFLKNCNTCIDRPNTSFAYMNQITKKFLKEKYRLSYERSIFAIKSILKEAEVDDARPTVIRKLNHSPNFFSVLSGKINTIYDIETILDNL